MRAESAAEGATAANGRPAGGFAPLLFVGFAIASIGGPLALVALDALSLVNPEEFYDKLLKPSLGALFISQLVVFVVLPLFKRGLRWLPLVAIASGLMVWGLYTLVAGGAST